MVEARRNARFTIREGLQATVVEHGGVQAWSTEDASGTAYAFAYYVLSHDDDMQWWIHLFHDDIVEENTLAVLMHGESCPDYAYLNTLCEAYARNLFYDTFGIPANQAQ